jgi:Zn-dependent protease with chaperone function
MPSASYPKKLTKLEAHHFMHPSDISALNTVAKVPGLGLVVKKMNEHGFERVYRLRHMADDIRCTERTCSKYYRMMEDCGDILNMPDLPDLFIDQNPTVNAFTVGVDNPMIVLNSGLIDLLDDDEMFAVIAHEMGHIKCEHVLYHTVAQFLAVASGMLGIAGLVLSGVNLAILEWYRKSELSADRAALLAMQDSGVVVNVLMKLAGGSQKIAGDIDYDDFIKQSRDYQKLASSDKLFKMFRLYNTMLLDHPFPVMRASEIVDWSGGNEYSNILRGKYPAIVSSKSIASTKPKDWLGELKDKVSKSLSATDSECPSCGHVMPKGSKFCQQCGMSISAVRDNGKCPACDVELPPNSSWCLNCGAKLGGRA